MPTVTRATPGPPTPPTAHTPQLPPAPNANAAPNTNTTHNNPTINPGPGTGHTSIIQQINDPQHNLAAFPRVRAANGTMDNPIQDATRYVQVAKARCTGYKR